MTTQNSSPSCHTLTTPTPPSPPSPPSPPPQKTPSFQQPKNQKSKVPKRIKVTDPSGWTHIIRGSKAQKKQSYIKPMAHLKPQEVAANMTSVEKAGMRLKGFASDWEKSECREKMEEMMEEDVLMSDKVNISNCVCLGLGSLTGINGSKSSWYELVTLIWILEILGMLIHTNQTPPPPITFLHSSPFLSWWLKVFFPSHLSKIKIKNKKKKL